MHLPQEKQSNWFARHKFLTAILIFIGCVAFVGAFSGGSQQNNTSQQQTTNTPTQSPETTTAPATPKTWQKVIELSGNAAKRSESFKLNGGETRLKYTVNGNAVFFAAYVLEQGKDLQKEGGFPEVTVTEAGSDETRLTKSSGNYYLDINTANTNWSVTIEELK